MSNLESETSENLPDRDEDHDDDDDELNSAHKVIPNIDETPTLPQETTTSPGTEKPSTFDVRQLLKENSKTFLNTTIPKDYSGFVQCSIKREKLGIQRGFSTLYSLYLDDQSDNTDQNPFLHARKQWTVGGHSQYYLSDDYETLVKNPTDENSLAKVRGVNLTGTDYILYDHSNNDKTKVQLLAIVYERHIFGTSEPRKLSVIIPTDGKEIEQDKGTIVDRWRSDKPTDLIEFKNKSPRFEEASKRFILNFNDNRVKVASHKNFQLVATTSDDHAGENVVLQFGRMDENTFALDYRHPLTALQAFSIVLSAFHNRFRT